MLVTINNVSYELSPGTTLENALAEIRLESASGVALAVNESIVPRHEWAAFSLNANDRILLIRATQGG